MVTIIVQVDIHPRSSAISPTTCPCTRAGGDAYGKLGGRPSAPGRLWAAEAWASAASRSAPPNPATLLGEFAYTRQQLMGEFLKLVAPV